MNRLTFWLAAPFAGMVMSHPALAYIGPGAGLSAIGTFVAVIGAVLLLIAGFVWYPVKRLLSGRKATGHAAGNETTGPDS